MDLFTIFIFFLVGCVYAFKIMYRNCKGEGVIRRSDWEIIGGKRGYYPFFPIFPF